MAPHMAPQSKRAGPLRYKFLAIAFCARGKNSGENGGDKGDSGDIIINKVNNDITDIDLIGYSGVSTNVSTNARGGDILLLSLTRLRLLEW
jgi:hypothetical protein